MQTFISVFLRKYNMKVLIVLALVVVAFATEELDRCSQPAETGMCRGNFRRYHFDKSAGQCKEFVYGGCGGNENNFKTEKDCESACGSEETQNCHDKPETGMCRGYFPMWYYDEDANDCKKFIYGGCDGNGNRYPTRGECLKKCANIWESDSDRCSQPAETGVCRAYFPMYFFDKNAGRCKEFIYGGCGGNENRFETEEECESACGNRAAGVCGENERYNGCGTACPLTCENYDNPPKVCVLMCKIGCECEEGFVRRSDGKCIRPEQCPKSQAALDRPDCDKAPETGLCDAYIPRYYYNEVEGQCKQFIYGGCGGNRNNFKTEEECYNKCGALSYVRNACEEDKAVGTCKEAFARFYFNKNSGQCEPFIYGGCGGNSNNFMTQEDCEEVCIY